jgi:hypothetical protein
LVEIVRVNGIWSKVLDSEEAQEQDSKSFTPNEALPNKWDSHSMRSLSCADGESKPGGEDSGSGSGGGAGAGAGANTGASTKKGNRERQFKCDIEGCDKAFVRNHHRLVHMRSHSKTKPYVRPFCIPPSLIPLLTYLHLL